MDLLMPVMGGEEALALLKQINPAVPVVLSSGPPVHPLARRQVWDVVRDIIEPLAKGVSLFKSAEAEALYRAAYDASLSLWPVRHESLEIPIRFDQSISANLDDVSGAPLFPAVRTGKYASRIAPSSCADRNLITKR